jgi:hypothetical protein
VPTLEVTSAINSSSRVESAMAAAAVGSVVTSTKPRLPDNVIRIPIAPDIIPRIDWSDIVWTDVPETQMQMDAAMEPIERALFHLRMLLSLDSSTTRVYLSAPDMPWMFAAGSGGSIGFLGVGTNVRNTAIQLVLTHIAVLTFNEARRDYGFDSTEFSKAAVRVIRLVEIAKLYGSFSTSPKHTPPAIIIKLDIVCKLIVEIAMYRVHAYPVPSTPESKLTSVLKKLGTIHELLKQLDGIKQHKAWAMWIRAVADWYTVQVCLYMAHHVVVTESVVDNPALTASIQNGTQPATHYTEARALLEVTKQTMIPLYAHVCEKEKSLLPWQSSTNVHTPVLLQSIATGDVFYTFTPNVATTDLMREKGMEAMDTLQRRTTLLHALLPESGKPIPLVAV